MAMDSVDFLAWLQSATREALLQHAEGLSDEIYEADDRLAKIIRRLADSAAPGPR